MNRKIRAVVVLSDWVRCDVIGGGARRQNRAHDSKRRLLDADVPADTCSQSRIPFFFCSGAPSARVGSSCPATVSIAVVARVSITRNMARLRRFRRSGPCRKRRRPWLSSPSCARLYSLRDRDSGDGSDTNGGQARRPSPRCTTRQRTEGLDSAPLTNRRGGRFGGERMDWIRSWEVVTEGWASRRAPDQTQRRFEACPAHTGLGDLI